MEIQRLKELAILEKRLKQFPVVALLGPRQCGKTTLAHQFARRHPRRFPVHLFDLEHPSDLAKLENPALILENLKGCVIIDEIQRRPDLFPVLRVLVDRHRTTRYLILGSASRDLIHQGSESLAGRISTVELGGFGLDTCPGKSKTLWIRGGFPRSFLARSEEESFRWREEFIATFLERDIPTLGFSISAATLRRFWNMLSHYHGQVFQASGIGRSLQFSDSTARRYLDLLTGTFMIRQLQPWFSNTKKRLIKRPKIYFRDSGILHGLFSCKTYQDLLSYPKLGASWEGFALEQAIQHLGLREEDCFFWGTHTGAEVDLVFQKKGKLWGIEAKYSEAPRITASMKSALKEIPLAYLWVIHPGRDNYPLGKKISTVSIENLSFNLLK